MDIDGKEEHRRAIGVNIADQPAIIHIAHNVFDRIKGKIDMRRVVHGKDDAGDDLRDQAEGQNAAESPPIVEVFRRRVIDKAVMGQTKYRQARIEPLGKTIAGIICAFTAHFLNPNQF